MSVCMCVFSGIRSFLESSKVLDPHSSISALPPERSHIRFTSINFAKNQLFLSLIGLSPLTSSHPRLLLQTSVRSSKRHYAFFNLFKIRSLSFGSNEANLTPLSTCFGYASTSLLTHTCFIQSLTHYAKGTLSLCFNKLKHKLQLLVSILFQIFSLPTVQGSFHLSLTVLVHYRSIYHIQAQKVVLLSSNSLTCSTFLFYTFSSYRTFTFFGHASQTCFAQIYRNCLLRFLSPILTESRLISFPKGTKMFQFPLCESLCGFPRWVFVPFSRFVLDTTFRIV